MFNKHQKTDALLLLVKLMGALCVVGGYSFAWYRWYRQTLWLGTFFAKGDYTQIALFAAMYLFFARLYGGFDLGMSNAGELVYAQGVALVLTNAFMYIVTCLLAREVIALVPALVTMVATMVLLWIWAVFATRLTDRLQPPERVALLYDDENARADAKEIIETLSRRFRLVAEVDVSGGTQAALALLREKQCDCVMLCGIESSQRNDLVKICIAKSVKAYVRPCIGDFLIKGAKQMQMNNLPVFKCTVAEPAVWYLVCKRIMDIALGLMAMVVFSPFMLVTAIAIKVYDGGPIFYRQLRLTKNRKPFYVYKFRSMRVDAEKDGVARLASQNDDRITPVGKIIRSLRIDEMPQLWCILSGDMTIVGPRPERPEIAADYEKEMPEFALRLQAKAGLTGLAQVYGKYNTSPYNKLQMDLEYIGSMNLMTDLKIILATIKILFMPESTEGVSQGQTTAKKEKK